MISISILVQAHLVTEPFFSIKMDRADVEVVRNDGFGMTMTVGMEWTVAGVLEDALIGCADDRCIIQRVKVYNFRLNGRFFKNFKAKLEQRRKAMKAMKARKAKKKAMNANERDEVHEDHESPAINDNFSNEDFFDWLVNDD